MPHNALSRNFHRPSQCFFRAPLQVLLAPPHFPVHIFHRPSRCFLRARCKCCRRFAFTLPVPPHFPQAAAESVFLEGALQVLLEYRPEMSTVPEVAEFFGGRVLPLQYVACYGGALGLFL